MTGPAPAPDEPGRADQKGSAARPQSASDPGAVRMAAALALATHVADRAAPLAEFGCGRGAGGAALARAGFTAIDGFDPSDENLAAAGRTGVYRRLARAGLPALKGVAPGVYANAAVVEPLDPARIPPEALDAMLALLPPTGCLLFARPGGGTSVGRFRTRVLELCEHFVAQPVFRAASPGGAVRGLQSTLYVLKKR